MRRFLYNVNQVQKKLKKAPKFIISSIHINEERTAFYYSTQRNKIPFQAGEVSAATLSCVSDGFMLNLGAVLLQLCQPFCTTTDDPKSLKIDPTYGAVPVSDPK